MSPCRPCCSRSILRSICARCFAGSLSSSRRAVSPYSIRYLAAFICVHPGGVSEPAPDGEGVKVQARIMATEIGVGHVLEAVAQDKMRSQFQPQSGMTGELKRNAKVRRPELVPAEQRRAHT